MSQELPQRPLRQKEAHHRRGSQPESPQAASGLLRDRNHREVQTPEFPSAEWRT